MIAVSESLVLLADSHPALARALKEATEEWVPEDPPPTLVSSSMARNLMILSNVPNDQLVRVAEAIERVLTLGEEIAKDVVATGFLEAVVSGVDEGSETGKALFNVLGTEARNYCQAWRSFTDGTDPIDPDRG